MQYTFLEKPNPVRHNNFIEVECTAEDFVIYFDDQERFLNYFRIPINNIKNILK